MRSRFSSALGAWPHSPRALSLSTSLVLIFALAPCNVVAEVLRRFEVSDSIQMSAFTQDAIFSPDRRHFITVTQRGVLPQGVTETTLWLFESSAPKPTALARLSTIEAVRWESEGSAVLFLGRNGSEHRQLFRARLGDRAGANALTPPTQDVTHYAERAGTIAYFTGPAASADKAWWSVDPAAADIVAGTGQPLMHLLYPNYEKNHLSMPTTFEVWTVTAKGSAPVSAAATKKPLQVLGTSDVSGMEVSPDGRQLVALVHAERIPAQWARYEVPAGFGNRPFHPDAADSTPESRKNDYGRALQYVLIDLAEGTSHPLLNAPVADFRRGGAHGMAIAWSPDARHVAVSSTYLPLERKDSVTRPCELATVDVSTGKWACPDGRAKPPWLVSATQAAPLEISVRQSIEEPPVLVAKDTASGREHVILDPNPQLAGLDRGTASLYTWRDAHGRAITGGLARPPDFRSDRRYPLVIQTHGFRPRRFFRTGGGDTAVGGRALAARDIVVLQVDEPNDAYMGTWEEASENGTKIYLAAIDQLAREGVIDSTKVGITGYSRMGFYVAKAIADAPDRFAAAVVANADPGSLIGYYSYIDYILPTYASAAADLFAGAPPYGEGLQKWLERAPGLRTERIRAPVLISAADPQHLISLWGLYAPLRDQHKPVELQYIRSGQHNLTKPLHQLAHQEMLVDWFDFWLNRHEEPSSEKRPQYERWRKLAGSVPAASR